MTTRLETMRPGDEIPSLLKGPITRQHLAEWCAAENDYYAIHYDDRLAKSLGLPGAPIQGTYRNALMGQMVTRWLGPEGRLRKISCTYRSLDLEHQTLKCRGKVLRSETTAHGGEIELEIWVENDRGEVSTSGRATVVFPLRR